MKNKGKITSMLLMILLAGSFSLSAQRGMRGMRPDSAGMRGMRMERMHMPLMMQHPDSVKMGGMHHGMSPMQMNHMDRFMCPMCMMGRQMAGNWQRGRGMNQAPGMGRMGRGMRMMAPGMQRPAMGMQRQAPGMRVMENVPNLTDKQKKDIADLRLKQQEDMQKFRGEMQEKMNDLRESHKTKVMNILTDDQKKWVEENTPKPLEK